VEAPVTVHDIVLVVVTAVISFTFGVLMMGVLIGGSRAADDITLTHLSKGRR
jgi:hypothetical protein